MKVAILTISDGCYARARQDKSGQALAEICLGQQWEILERSTAPDEVPAIQRQVAGLIEARADLVLTTGGTGLGPRDVTPEAVLPLLEKQIPGLGEMMRQRGLEQTIFAAISRSFAGSIGNTLLICLPGSPRGASDSFQAVLPLIRHLHDLLNGRTRHGAKDEGWSNKDEG